MVDSIPSPSYENRSRAFLEYLKAHNLDLRPAEKKGYNLGKPGEHPIAVDSERFERIVRHWLMKENIPQSNELVSNLLPIIDMLVHPKLIP